MFKEINPDSVIKPISNYSNGVIVPSGRTLYISGQVGVDENAKLPGDHGVEAQTRQTFDNIKSIVEAAGGSMQDIVCVNIFVTNIEDGPIVSKIRSEYFPVSPFPASTLIGNCTFVLPVLKVEVNAIALLPAA